MNSIFADVAELADALASGASGGNPVEVRVLSSVLLFSSGFRHSDFPLIFGKKYTFSG